MDGWHIKDNRLMITEASDPDDCRSSLTVETLQGCSHITIEVRGRTSDTKEWHGWHICLEKEKIELLYKILSDHLTLVNKKREDY